jgi:ketosteroid isomerase-like protein
MRISQLVGVGLAVIGATSALRGHDPKPAAAPTPEAPRVAVAGSPAAAVEAFHSALAAGNREEALRWLDPQVVIFESGGAEMSRDEYAGHHLGGDMEFVGAVKTEVLDRQAHSEGDVAWVLTRARTTGQFRERDLDVDGVETMVLRRAGGQWRIVHVHWSSAARKSE